MARRIVLTGGLSGGHTFPLIAVAREIRTLTQGDVEFLFLGSKGPFEKELFVNEGIHVKFLLTAKWRRYFSFLNFLDLFKFPLACIQALWYLLWFMPDAIFSKGGAASVPIALAAFIYRIPILMHDSDAVAGRANRFVARFAKRIAIAYDRTRQYFPKEKVLLTGNPVRQEIFGANPDTSKQYFQFNPEQPVVMVMGGSLGARALNHLIVKAVPDFIEQGLQILHVVGGTHMEEVQKLAQAEGIPSDTPQYHPVTFLNAEDIGRAYAAADVVIARAGAGSITELAALKKTVILVPLPTAANDEQRLNAYEVAKTGGAIVAEEANIGVNLLSTLLRELLGDAERRRTMGEAMYTFYHPDAAKKIAEGVISMY